MKRAVWLGCLSWAMALVPAMAQPPQAQELVQQLGAAQFHLREQAAEALISLGPEALEALRQGAQSPDAEVRHRCRELLEVIRRRLLQQQVQLLLHHPEKANPALLPGWKLFVQQLGSSQAQVARVYQKALLSLQELFLVWDNLPQFRQLLQQAILEAYIRSRGYWPGGHPSSEELTGLFVLSTRRDLPLDQGSLLTLLFLSYSPPFSQQVRQGAQAAALRRLLGRWLQQHQDRLPTERVISWGMYFQLPQTIGPATRLLSAAGANPYSVQSALLVVARFGSAPQHLALVQKHFDNQAVVYRQRRRSNEVWIVQVRDVALAVAIYLSGKDPRQFGFREFRKHPSWVLEPSSLGFSSAQARQQAFDRWKKFQQKNNSGEDSQ